MEAYRLETVKVRSLEFAIGHWPNTGPVAFCIHGLTANHLSWTYVAERLQAAGYDVYAMDLRGRGRSSKPNSRYGVEVHAADAAEIIRKLTDKPVRLLGHSLGAMISVTFAAAYPELVTHVVLVDGGGVVQFDQAALAIQAIKPSLARLGKVWPNEDAYQAIMRQSPYYQAWNDMLSGYFRYELEPTAGGVRCNIPPRVIEAEFQAQGGSMSKWRALWRYFVHRKYVNQRLAIRNNPPYKHIQAPVLILQAGTYNQQPGDQILPDSAVQRMLQEIPKAQHVVIPGTQHYDILISENSFRDDTILQFLA